VAAASSDSRSESEVAERTERDAGAGGPAPGSCSGGSEVCDAGLEGHGVERKTGSEMSTGSEMRSSLLSGADGGHFGPVPWKRSRLNQMTRVMWRKLYLVSQVYSIGFGTLTRIGLPGHSRLERECSVSVLSESKGAGIRSLEMLGTKQCFLE